MVKISNYIVFLLLFICFSCTEKFDGLKYWDGLWDEKNPGEDAANKPRFIWIDAAANFPDFANNINNIKRDLKLIKESGFTDIVVDVRPTTGDVLFKTDVVDQVKSLYAWVGGEYKEVVRTEKWDYLQAFIDEARALQLRVHASCNTFVGGNNGQGLLFREPDKKEWATYLNQTSGIKNIMDTSEGEKFLNPANDDVQNFICNLLKDLAKYDLDGIFLDRGRFWGLQADFSELTKEKFEAYIGETIENFPEDILPYGGSKLPATYPKFLTKWLEFRAKTISDFMRKAQQSVKSINDKIKFGVYVGGWYSTYYEVGVNWASSSYDPSQTYDWATSKYKQFGYAGLMDQMLIGAYANPLKVNGSGEWTMEGFCRLAKDKIKNDCPSVCGGPDIGNWDPRDEVEQDQENIAVKNSVKACMDACDGYFLFDLIHLKNANQWEYIKEGIQLAIKK